MSGQRSGPCGDTGRAETLAAARPQVHDQCPTDRQERARLAALDDRYVANAHRRAADPIIRRYRKLLREAA